MAVYLSNAFSLSMIDRENHGVTIMPISLKTALGFLDVKEGNIEPGEIPFISVVGHADTAGLLSDLLGLDIPMNRISIKLGDDDVMIVAQYMGPRLPEGTTKLPEGSSFEFWLI